MPSPFPGMAPFLEDPRIWESLHTRLITVLSELLSSRVRPHYLVEVETTVYVVTPDDLDGRQVKPDLYRVRRAPPEPSRAAAGAITEPTLVEPRYPMELRQHYLEARNARNQAVVATVEVLSPANKAPRTASHRRPSSGSEINCGLAGALVGDRPAAGR